MSLRMALATAAASAAIVLAIGLGLYITPGRSAGWDMGTLSHALFFLFLFGWLPAFLVTFGVGALGLRVSRRRHRRLPLSRTALFSMAVGGVKFPLAWYVFWNSYDGIVQLMLIGAAAGTLGGAVFWLIAIGGDGYEGPGVESEKPLGGSHPERRL